MPNRFIKESIRTSDTLASISPAAERLFWRLTVSADDFGRFDARPSIVLGQCMTAFIETVPADDILRWLRELESVGLIQTYEVESRPYLMLTTWNKYQRTRAKDSKFPAPQTSRGHPLSIVSDSKHVQSDVVSYVNVFDNENVKKDMSSPDGSESHLEVIKKTGGAQSSETGKGSSTTVEASAEKLVGDYSSEFEMFWAAYPRRGEKRGAYKVWTTRLKEGVRSQDLIVAAERYAADCKKKNTEMSFMKLAKTFLGPSRPYEDYLQVQEAQGPHKESISDDDLEEREFLREVTRQAYERQGIQSS